MSASDESSTQQEAPDPSPLNVFFKYFSDEEQVIKAYLRIARSGSLNHGR